MGWLVFVVPFTATIMTATITNSSIHRLIQDVVQSHVAHVSPIIMLWSALYRVRTSLSETQHDAIEAAFTSRIQVLSGTASGIDACHSLSLQSSPRRR